MTIAPDGLFQYGGEPVGGARFTNPWATVRFVSGISGEGSDGNDGTSIEKAKATIQSAVTASSEQDIIYVRPLAMTSDASDVTKYAEQVTVQFAAHNLSIIGVHPPGDQNYGAKVRYATSGYVFEVYAGALNLENFCVHKGGSITGAINLRGITGYATEGGSNGAQIHNCQIRYGGIMIEGGYNSTISNTVFINAAGAVTVDGSGIPNRGHRIIGCDFLAANGSAVATAYVVIKGSTNEFLMKNCFFDQPTTADEYINSTGTVDGLIADCFFADDAITFGANAADEIYLAAGTITCAGCYDNVGLCTAA